MSSIELAKEIAEWKDTTCVICGETPYSSHFDDELTQLATDFLGLIEVTQDALNKIKDVVAYWPIEVDRVMEYLERLK